MSPSIRIYSVTIYGGLLRENNFTFLGRIVRIEDLVKGFNGFSERTEWIDLVDLLDLMVLVNGFSGFNEFNELSESSGFR